MALNVKKPATATKPVAKAPLAKPASKTASKTVSKPAKKATSKKASKPQKPFEVSELVTFRGYAQKPAEGEAEGSFKPGDELAVVSTRVEGETTMIAVVKSAEFHKYMENPERDDVVAEEVIAPEIQRLNRKVEQVYHLPVVGEMQAMLDEHSDVLELAQGLYDDANKAFFYLGGALSKLFKEKDPNTKLPLFASYKDAKGKAYGKDRAEEFLHDSFGEGFGGMSKANKLMLIYERFSGLENAEELVKELSEVGWWKATIMANYVTDQNAAELVERAKTLSSDALTETLKTEYTSAGGKNAAGKSATRVTIKRSTFTFKLYEDAGAGVGIILEAAQKQLGVGADAAFEHIVTEWANDHLDAAAKRAGAAKDRAQAQMKKSGVKLPPDHPLYVAPKEEAKAPAKTASKVATKTATKKAA